MWIFASSARHSSANELEFAGVVDTGHVRPGSLGELYRERTRVAARAVDQHLLPSYHPGGPFRAFAPG